jgi:diguanylate cyclase (GGDEF)-like protein
MLTIRTALSRVSLLLVIALLLPVIISKVAHGAQREAIDYCVDPDWLPYEAIRDGKHVGISSDYLAILAEKLNVDFRLVPTNTWLETLEFLQQGKCHLVPILNASESRSQYLKFSEVYFSAPNVLVSTDNQPFLQDVDNIGARKLGMPRGYRMVEFLERYYPAIEFRLMDNEKEALIAVSKGDIDLTITSILSANSYIQSAELNNLKIAGWALLEDRLRVGVTEQYEHLLPAINTALEEINDGHRMDIYQRWSNVKIVNEPDYHLFWKAASVTGIVFVLVFIYFLMLRRMNWKLQQQNNELEMLRRQLEASNKELSYSSSHDPLTQLYNRHHFNQQLQRRVEDLGETCVLIVDVDHFKQVNDEFGHSAGDEILLQFADVLRQEVRATDVVARWGGEEFVIFCPQTNVKDAQLLCERLLSSVRQKSFEPVAQLTCSIGGARLAENETVNECLERADKALYRAKNKGRDTWLWDGEASTAPAS